MKKLVFILFVAVLLSTPLCAQEANKQGIKSILNHYAAGKYVAGDISKADLEQIIQSGINSPSARNRQPWLFTVVQNNDLAKKIIPASLDGNVIIVISAKGDGKTNGDIILDCGLAAESIYLAAQALGYGSRIYTGPINDLNKNLKKELDLPSDHNAIVIVRIGKVPSGIDAVTAASSRNPATASVKYK
jgi:nitroreductase